MHVLHACVYMVYSCCSGSRLACNMDIICVPVCVYIYIPTFYRYIHKNTRDLVCECEKHNIILHVVCCRGRLVAAGLFTKMNGRSQNYIAVLESGDWQPLDGGLGGPVNAMQAIDNCVYTCGSFETAGGRASIGGVTVRSAARWCDKTQGALPRGWEAIDWGGVQVGVCNALTVA
jgi:hypothetical protein